MTRPVVDLSRPKWLSLCHEADARLGRPIPWRGGTVLTDGCGLLLLAGTWARAVPGAGMAAKVARIVDDLLQARPGVPVDQEAVTRPAEARAAEEDK